MHLQVRRARAQDRKRDNGGGAVRDEVGGVAGDGGARAGDVEDLLWHRVLEEPFPEGLSWSPVLVELSLTSMRSPVPLFETSLLYWHPQYYETTKVVLSPAVNFVNTKHGMNRHCAWPTCNVIMDAQIDRGLFPDPETIPVSSQDVFCTYWAMEEKHFAAGTARASG